MYRPAPQGQAVRRAELACRRWLAGRRDLCMGLWGRTWQVRPLSYMAWQRDSPRTGRAARIRRIAMGERTRHTAMKEHIRHTAMEEHTLRIVMGGRMRHMASPGWRAPMRRPGARCVAAGVGLP